MESEVQPARTSKGVLWTGRVLSALPVLMIVGGAIFGLAKPAMVTEQMTHYGYPEGVSKPLVIVELLCALLYAIPQTSVLGAILLTGYLGGATATHVRVSEPFFIPIIVGVVIWLGLFLRDARVRALIPIRR